MNVLKICSELVKIRSENPPGYTDEVINYIKGLCDQIGLNTKIVSRDRHANLISTKQNGKLLLCGHVDVVPALDAGWDQPPFSGIKVDDRLFGRGTTDMKGGCAVLISAIARSIEAHGECNADVAFVCDEEGDGKFGLKQLLEEGFLKAEDCLIAEPTPVSTPLIGEKGLFRAKISFTGNAGHASLYPVLGNSAITEACKFVSVCDDIYNREWSVSPVVKSAISAGIDNIASALECSPDEAEKILSHVTYNPGIIRGGERINIIAQTCAIKLDMRIPWGCNSTILEKILTDSEKNANIHIDEKIDPTFSNPGWLCSLICDGIKHVHGTNPTPGVSHAASDARFLRERGAEAILYGPGDIKLLHSVNESVPVKHLLDAEKVYQYVLERIL